MIPFFRRLARDNTRSLANPSTDSPYTPSYTHFGIPLSDPANAAAVFRDPNRPLAPIGTVHDDRRSFPGTDFPSTQRFIRQNTNQTGVPV